MPKKIASEAAAKIAVLPRPMAKCPLSSHLGHERL
jgi:hypothetical protein